MVQIWWSQLERMMSYRADKQGVDAHIRTHTQTDAGNDNTRRPKLASGKNLITTQSFLFKIHTLLWGQGMKCPLWVPILIYIHLSYHTIHLIMTDHVMIGFHFTSILIYYHTTCDISLWQTMLWLGSILHQYWYIITLHVISHYDRPCYDWVPFYINTDILSHYMWYLIMTDHVMIGFHFTSILIYYHTTCDISLWQTMLWLGSILHQYWYIITLHVISHYDRPCYDWVPFYINTDILSHYMWYLITTDHVLRRFHFTPILIYYHTKCDISLRQTKL